MLKVFIKLFMYEIMINLHNYQHEVLKLFNKPVHGMKVLPHLQSD